MQTGFGVPFDFCAGGGGISPKIETPKHSKTGIFFRTLDFIPQTAITKGPSQRGTLNFAGGK